MDKKNSFYILRRDTNRRVMTGTGLVLIATSLKAAQEERAVSESICKHPYEVMSIHDYEEKFGYKEGS